MNVDIRVIVHRAAKSWLICYVGHHDDAYRWAERHEFRSQSDCHSMELVEVRETVEERRIVARDTAPPGRLAFKSDAELLACGLPADWLGRVRQADDDGILVFAEHLGPDLGGTLISLAVGDSAGTHPLAKKGEKERPATHTGFRTIRDEADLDLAFRFAALDLLDTETARGVRLFRFLAAQSDKDKSVGIGYADFVAFLYGRDAFSEVTGRNFLPGDNPKVIRLAAAITKAARGRIEVGRGGTRIRAGMDTFIWSARKPHNRPDKAFSQRLTSVFASGMASHLPGPEAYKWGGASARDGLVCYQIAFW